MQSTCNTNRNPGLTIKTLLILCTENAFGLTHDESECGSWGWVCANGSEASPALHHGPTPGPYTRALHQGPTPGPSATALHHGPKPGPYTRALRHGPPPRPYTSATECSSAPNWKQLVTWTVLLHKYNFPFLLSQELQQHKHIV